MKYCEFVITVSVCHLFVCPLTYLKATHPNFTKFFVHVICGGCGRVSVLLWRQCDALSTSGFVDDVIFSRNGANDQNQWWCVYFNKFTRWQHQSGV